MNISQQMPPRTPSGEKTTYEQIFERGFEEGYKIGFEKGYKIGFEEGYKEGYKVGIEKGIEKAIQTYMLKNLSVSDQEISDTFDVKVDFVRQIRARN